MLVKIKYGQNIFCPYIIGAEKEKNMKKNNKNGFTLIELLVVIAIIGLLAGMFMGTFSAVRSSAKKSKARSEIDQIKMAWNYYLTEYHRFPSVNIDSMDSDTLKIVCGHISDPNDPVYDDNRLKISFFDFSTNSIPYISDGYCDPWGSIYKVKLAVGQPWNEVTVNGGVVKSAIAVWSLGPDMEEFTKDDLVSWK